MPTARQPADENTHRLSPVPLRTAVGAAGPHDPAATTPRPRAAPARGRGELPEVRGYELLSELGRGGMGVVYLAVQQSLRRTVAIKMLPPGAGADPLDVARFFSEAEAVAAVAHPHVVQVYEFALQDGRPFLAMEYLPGGSLGAKLHAAGPLPADAAAALLEKLARAVQAAHEQGVVHRDLKPGNVLFTESPAGDGVSAWGEPKVTDFGLAKRGPSDLTRTREVMGTPAYMAPEQASGRTRHAGPAADIHALGAILYECLTGRPPFGHAEGDPLVVLNRVVNDPPARPGRLARVPLDLELICLRCLEKAPQDRYPTAAALADDLARFSGRQPVSVRPPGVLERGVKWARRRPTAAAAYALTGVVAALLAVGAVLVPLWARAEDARRAAEAANGDLQAQARLTAEARNRAVRGEDDARRAQQLAEARKGEAETALHGEAAARQALLKVQRELVRTKYYHDVSLAHREGADGNAARADQLLAQCPEELRGWEWWHCRAVAHPEVASFAVPDCLALTYAPDGKHLVVCTTTSRVEHRDPVSGAVGKGAAIPSRAALRRWLSADGRRLLVVAYDEKYDFEPLPEDRSGVCAASVWDTHTGKALLSWKGMDGTFPECSVSADGSVAVVTGDRDGSRARSYDLTTGKLIAELPDRISSPYSSITADGKLALAVTMDDNRFVATTLWETRTGKVVQRFNHVHNRSIVWMAQARLSPDGGHLVFLSDKGDLGFWKVGQPGVLQYVTGAHTGAGFRIAFSGDGALCATAGGEEGVRVWRTSTGEALGTFNGHRGTITHLAFDPVRHQVLSVDALGQAKVWRVGGGLAVNRFEPPGAWAGPAAVNDRADRMFVPYIFPDRANALLLHRDDQKRVLVPRPEHVTDALFQPNGTLVAAATAGPARALEFWDASTGAPVRKIPLPGSPTASVAFSADGTRAAGAFGMDSLRVWEVATGKEVLNAPWQHIEGVAALSGDGKRAAWGSVVGFVAVYDVAAGKRLCLVRLPDNQPVTALALNHDGSQFAAGTKVWSVHLFDVPAAGAPDLIGLTEKSPLAHPAPVTAVAYSPKGDRLVSGSEDGTVKLWDPAARLEVLGLKAAHRVPVKRLLFSPDGGRLVAVGATRGATVFDGTAPK